MQGQTSLGFPLPNLTYTQAATHLGESVRERNHLIQRIARAVREVETALRVYHSLNEVVAVDAKIFHGIRLHYEEQGDTVGPEMLAILRTVIEEEE